MYELKQRRILALTESAAIAARRIAKGESGLIRMGFTASSSYNFLPRLLALANSSLKGLGVVLNEMVPMLGRQSACLPPAHSMNCR